MDHVQVLRLQVQVEHKSWPLRRFWARKAARELEGAGAKGTSSIAGTVWNLSIAEWPDDLLGDPLITIKISVKTRV